MGEIGTDENFDDRRDNRVDRPREHCICPRHLVAGHKNENKRKSLTRLRIHFFVSAHTLEIERGRYKKLKREERLCI